MRHPAVWIPEPYRGRLFLVFLILTMLLFAILWGLDQPLRNPAAPNGVVSFELAGTPERAFQIMVSWEGADDSLPRIFQLRPYLFAAFGLGIDYLFMPSYALTLAFGTLSAAHRHAGRIRSFGAAAGSGALAAALFDAVENFALWQVLLGAYDSAYPALAAVCAVIKFGLIGLALLYILAAWSWPRTPHAPR